VRVMELAEVIRDLREELERAIVTGEGEALRFELGPVELEVSVAIEAGAQAGAKARFWVVELGAQGTADRTSTQRIKLVLSPRLGPDGAAPLVSGPAAAGER
jgi:hypothetical protein